MQPKPNFHKPQCLSKTGPRLTAVNRRIVDNPNDYATRFDDSPELLGHAFEVPRMPAVCSQVVVGWTGHDKVDAVIREGLHRLYVVAADDLIDW